MLLRDCATAALLGGCRLDQLKETPLMTKVPEAPGVTLKAWALGPRLGSPGSCRVENISIQGLRTELPGPGTIRGDRPKKPLFMRMSLVSIFWSCPTCLKFPVSPVNKIGLLERIMIFWFV